MAPLFLPAWQDLPCIYCNSPVGSDGETDDGEFYSCAACREVIEIERLRVCGTIETSEERDDRRSDHAKRARAARTGLHAAPDAA
jgi:hypothetical protein